MIKKYFLEFFLAWLKIPEFQRFQGHPLYVTGESYAGHYIPQIGNALFNSKSKMINLQGLAIGNGWTSPIPQNIASVTYVGMNRDILPYPEAEEKKDLKLAHLCNKGIASPNPFWAFSADDACYRSTPSPFTTGNVNPYDIRIPCTGELCYNMGYVREFFNQGDVRKAMGVEDFKGEYELCSMRVGDALSPDGDTDSALELRPVVDGGVRVLFYTGDKDWVCNWEGTKLLLEQFQWKGIAGWNRQKLKPGKFGEEMSYMNLKFIKIADSGHMVPHDQPETALGMLNEFIQV
jgi:cathepsin A (carboxypeptidase C)